MNNNYNYLIQNFLLTKFTNIYIIDIANDKTYIYSYTDNKQINVSEMSYSNFLSYYTTMVNSDDINKLNNILNIQKLREELQNGKKKITEYIKKKNQNGIEVSYQLETYLFNFENKDLILLYEDECNNTNVKVEKESQPNNDVKTHEMIDNISDGLLKIYNIFNSTNNSEEVKNIGNYINTILSDITTSYPEFNKAFNENAISVTSMATNTLLIIDDDVITRNILKKIFDSEYNIITCENGKEGIEVLQQNNQKNIFEKRDNIVGIFLDLVMPVMDGFAVLDYLNKNNYLNKIPVAIISGDYSKETRDKVYSYHIADMLEKPFNTEIIKHRINNLVNLYKSSNSLNEMILNQYADLKNIIDTIISAYKYDYKTNIEKVKKYTYILATDVMENYKEYNLNENKVSKITEASCFYDIGYYAIPRVMYSKVTNLTKEEADIVKNYPVIGSKIIKYGLKNNGDNTFTDYAYEITKYYHEKYDGTGYPEGLKEEAIPISAMIVSLATYYNNLTKNYTDDNYINSAIISLENTKFSPKIINTFKRVYNKLNQVSKEV